MPVTFASFEARGSYTDRGTGGAGQKENCKQGWWR